jgi:large subunit ribosomal protein L11
MAVAKKVKANIKFRVPAGKATPAPPVGSTLGAHGVNMMEFINAFTTEALASQIKKAAGVDKGSGVPNKTKVGQLTRAQVTELAEKKMQDMNAHNVAAAEKIVAGQARSMGIEVVD